MWKMASTFCWPLLWSMSARKRIACLARYDWGSLLAILSKIKYIGVRGVPPILYRRCFVGVPHGIIESWRTASSSWIAEHGVRDTKPPAQSDVIWHKVCLMSKSGPTTWLKPSCKFLLKHTRLKTSFNHFATNRWSFLVVVSDRYFLLYPSGCFNLAHLKAILTLWKVEYCAKQCLRWQSTSIVYICKTPFSRACMSVPTCVHAHAFIYA